MTRPNPGWQPLPDCLGCDRPMKRKAWTARGGYCSSCRPPGPSPVQALPDAGRLDMAEWQQLVARRGAEERRARAEREARRRARRRG